MPKKAEHNRICKQEGYSSSICNSVNKWMDAPSAKFPGCQHREFRHSKTDCDSVAKEILFKTKNTDKAREAKQICMLHRKVDKNSDKGCGSKTLLED